MGEVKIKKELKASEWLWPIKIWWISTGSNTEPRNIPVRRKRLNQGTEVSSYAWRKRYDISVSMRMQTLKQISDKTMAEQEQLDWESQWISAAGKLQDCWWYWNTRGDCGRMRLRLTTGMAVIGNLSWEVKSETRGFGCTSLYESSDILCLYIELTTHYKNDESVRWSWKTVISEVPRHSFVAVRRIDTLFLGTYDCTECDSGARAAEYGIAWRGDNYVHGLSRRRTPLEQRGGTRS